MVICLQQCKQFTDGSAVANASHHFVLHENGEWFTSWHWFSSVIVEKGYQMDVRVKNQATAVAIKGPMPLHSAVRQ